MKIEVTQDCIDKGERFSPFYCPIALAVRKAIRPSRKQVWVCRMFIRVGTKGPAFSNTLETINFMDDFDYGKAVKPLSVELEEAQP